MCERVRARVQVCLVARGQVPFTRTRAQPDVGSWEAASRRACLCRRWELCQVRLPTGTPVSSLKPGGVLRRATASQEQTVQRASYRLRTHNTAIMSQPSLAPYVLKRPWLMRWAKPLSKWYFDAAAYRKLGLRYGRSGYLGRRHWDRGIGYV